MFDFLLDEKNFASLKEYIDFLNGLPDALTEIEQFSDIFRRSGHLLLTPPDGQALTRAATANKNNWTAIVGVVPSLGAMGRQLVGQTSIFVREFEQVAREAPNRQLLGNLDPSRFTPVNFGPMGSNRTTDLMQLLGNLVLRLDECARAVARLKALVVEVSQTIHSIFVRFIDSLTLRLCACHGPDPKIEIYYALGRIRLPTMQFDPNAYYSQKQRRAKAREHLEVLRGLYARSISAGNNIADLCHRMGYFLEQVKAELQANDRQQSLRRAQSSFAQLAYPLQELEGMARALVALSYRLEP
ncbi:hypothetical protein [Pseudomonas sp. G2-4]|uniref:hypothetical protein n=1 Tax=Pseudomonas sp. G2-4 TaxID=1506334 RepID=UPI0024B948D8|nr:hypothetical protein [Pseudomonas sp. G2-4]WHS61195.1 hypothetical protein QNH97_03910 [Pseudomonas sp. G2-4]